ncbi:MAG: trimeric intracellular cation channel family protein, partial [Oscillospiraceae bacterium]|nr:trimeric intracellular cation channel family protein [Oscillospiraceae bacterium]
MSNVLVFVLELIGTAAFAVSGAIVGIKKQMDLFGVIVLGVCTAVGGGIVRDVILGVTPPATFHDPVYTLTAAAVSVLMFLPHVRARVGRHEPVFDRLLLVMDAVGLGVFTVVGVQCAYRQAEHDTLFLTVFVGLITGVGGGVLRDVFSGERPYIFVRHFYACASIIGALICALCWDRLGANAAM